MPATIVGSANGRSITAFTTARPRKRSRTRTHATRVPANALNAATTIEIVRLSFSAARAWGAGTASQNAPRPPSSERATTAASGMSTMTLSQMVAIPRDSRWAGRVPGVAEESARRRAARAGAAGVRASLGSGDPRGLFDLRHGALVGAEELVVDLRPPATPLPVE